MRFISMFILSVMFAALTSFAADSQHGTPPANEGTVEAEKAPKAPGHDAEANKKDPHKDNKKKKK